MAFVWLHNTFIYLHLSLIMALSAPTPGPWGAVTQSRRFWKVVNPSAESARVVRGRAAVALQMSFTEICVEKLWKTSEPRI